MRTVLIVASLLISTAPLYAQCQQQNVAKLKADARNAVGIIGADKDKIHDRAHSNARWMADIRQRLAVVVADDEAGVQFPRTTRGHRVAIGGSHWSG